MFPKRDNYALQAEDARLRFLTYDQNIILSTTPATADEQFLYLTFALADYRISRTDGHLFRLDRGDWVSADSHGEVLTIFDYLCDAKPGRTATGTFAAIAALGKHVHSTLSIHSDALDRAIDADPDRFRQVCTVLGCKHVPGGDMAFSMKLFPDLPMILRFWHADEDFPPKLDLLWDSRTLDFIRYETTWFAAGVLRRRLSREMGL